MLILPRCLTFYCCSDTLKYTLLKNYLSKRCLHMSKSFNDLLSKVSSCSLKKVAVAVAQDEPVLEAVKIAKERNIADAILVGDKAKIEEIAASIHMDLSSFEII